MEPPTSPLRTYDVAPDTVSGKNESNHISKPRNCLLKLKTNPNPICLNSIGSLGHYDSELDVFGITVRNCSLTSTDNGARIKTYKNEIPSKASGITFQDITMDHVKNPIIIDQEYAARAGSVVSFLSPLHFLLEYTEHGLKLNFFFVVGLMKDSKVSISDVQFLNIKGTTISKVPVLLICSPSCPCKGVTLKDINLQYSGPPDKEEDTPFSSNCTNVKVNYVGEQNPPPCPS